MVMQLTCNQWTESSSLLGGTIQLRNSMGECVPYKNKAVSSSLTEVRYEFLAQLDRAVEF